MALTVPWLIPFLRTLIVAFAADVPEIVGVLSFVELPEVGETITGAAGADVSIVSVTALDTALVLLAASVAVAVRVYVPSDHALPGV